MHYTRNISYIIVNFHNFFSLYYKYFYSLDVGIVLMLISRFIEFVLEIVQSEKLIR